MASFVRLFKPQFAAPVVAGSKRQTVRPVPQRRPEAGDMLSLRTWSGLPYRSRQRILGETTIERVRDVTIHGTGQIEVAGCYLTTPEMEAFAKADGFADLEALLAWFRAEHGLPFTGILIEWNLSGTVPANINTP
ncbi:MAG TPA: ASCH domain-containing protein [Opitutaceae bacterium]|nr:ASCH domain-containing protein [Opitutaceae bacterium]